jgi:hypothetical protein
LEGGKELELPSGVYYLKGIKLGGKSKLKFQGIAFVFLEGGEEKGKEGEDKGKGNGKGKRESKEKSQEKGEGGFCLSVQGESVLGVFPSELRVIAKCGVKVESKSKIYGFVASEGDVKVEGGGEIFGGILARKFKGESKGKVHFDHFLGEAYHFFKDVGSKLVFIFDQRHPTLKLKEGTNIENFRNLLSSRGIFIRDVIFGDIIVVEIPDISFYEFLLSLTEVSFVGNLYITYDTGGWGAIADNLLIISLWDPQLQLGFLQDYVGIVRFYGDIVEGAGWFEVEAEAREVFSLIKISHLISQDSRVRYAEPNFYITPVPAQITVQIGPTITPNDQNFQDQWNLHNINSQAGWAFIYGGSISYVTWVFFIPIVNSIPIFSSVATTTIAIIDYGVEVTHNEFSGILFDGETSISFPDLPTRAHGTRVAGVAAAHTNNSTFISGVVWGSKQDRIMPFDSYNASGARDDIRSAVRNGADVLNKSWFLTQRSQSLEDAIATAIYCGRGGSSNCAMQFNINTGECRLANANATTGQGAISVFGAGNVPDCTDIPNGVGSWCPRGTGRNSIPYPQCLADTPCFKNRVFVVASVNVADSVSDFSCAGPEVSVAAPGEGVPTTDINNGFIPRVSGTSYAAPHVTGLAGLILKLNPELSVQDVFDIITRTAIDRGDPGRDNDYGYGRIDVERAVVWTIFRGQPLTEEFLPTNRLLIGEQPFSTAFEVFRVSNAGDSPLFATIRIHPQESGGISANLSAVGDNRSSDQAILVVSPGGSMDILISFRKEEEGPSVGRFSLIYCKEGFALEPEMIDIFGGGIVKYPDFLSPTNFESLSQIPILGPFLVSCTTFEITVATPGSCGDGVCSINENCINCSGDCGSCPPPPGGGSECASFCKLPLCIPIFCLPKAGCIYICFPPPGWATCPLCCLWCLFVFGDPGPGIPEEIPPELADIMQSPECNLCSESLKSEGGSAFGKPECKLCIEKVVQRGASLSYQCDMCLMNIRDYGEQGADSSWCAICKDQWEAMYEAYKDAVQSTMP